MRNNAWSQALVELVDAAGAALVRFWKQDMVQVGLTVGMFLALAVPLLLVVLLFWYLDYTGWRASPGFYTIGMSQEFGPLKPKVAVAAPAAVNAEGPSNPNMLQLDADSSPASVRDA